MDIEAEARNRARFTYQLVNAPAVHWPVGRRIELGGVPPKRALPCQSVGRAVVQHLDKRYIRVGITVGGWADHLMCDSEVLKWVNTDDNNEHDSAIARVARDAYEAQWRHSGREDA